MGREPLARVIAPLQEDEEEETAEINDDDQVASPPGCSGTDSANASSVPFSTPGSVPAACPPTRQDSGRRDAGKLQGPSGLNEAGQRHCSSNATDIRQGETATSDVEDA